MTVTERRSHSFASGIDVDEATIAPPQQPETRIIGVYNSPSHTCDPLTSCLSGLLHAPLKIRTIVLGDFNVDLTSELPPQRRMAGQLQALWGPGASSKSLPSHRSYLDELSGVDQRHCRRIRQ